MAIRLERKYILGDFLLEPDKRLLSRDGAPIHLSHKPFQVLLYLIEHRDRVVPRGELLEQFWPGKDVYEDTLRKSVSAIRKALGDSNSERPRYIETCWAEGYRYVGSFEEQLLPDESQTPTGGHVRTHLPEPERAGETSAAEEVTPSSSLPTRAVGPGRRRASKPATLLVASLTLALAASVMVAYRRRAETGESRKPGPPNSLAVLPLKNLTEDPADDYLSDGITESLINALSKVRGLKVIARGSVHSLTRRDVDPQELGRKLGVGAVLQGGVFRSEDRVRVEVRLVSAEDGHVLWASAPYDRNLNDIFALQDKITREVVAGLEHKLSEEDERRLGRRHTHHVEAYQEYLKGRYYLNQRSPDGIGKAIEYFRRAVELDPNYALAYAALAESYDKFYWFSHWFSKIRPHEAMVKQREAAARALALDDSLAEAHVAMATVYANEWNLPEAAREEERALELDPDNAEARHNYAYRLIDLGRPEEAVAQILRARDLDPLNVAMNVDVGEILLFARRYDDAIEALRHALEMDPNRANARGRLAEAYLFKGMEAEAVEEFLKGFTLEGKSPETVAAIRKAYASEGMRGFWRKRIEMELAEGHLEPVTVAVFYTLLGDRDQAFAWLERGYRVRSPYLVGLKSSAYFDPLRSDPRHEELVRRVGLP